MCCISPFTVILGLVTKTLKFMESAPGSGSGPTEDEITDTIARLGGGSKAASSGNLKRPREGTFVLSSLLFHSYTLLSYNMFPYTLLSYTLLSYILLLHSSLTHFSLTLLSLTLFSVTLFSLTLLSLTRFYLTLLSPLTSIAHSSSLPRRFSKEWWRGQASIKASASWRCEFQWERVGKRPANCPAWHDGRHASGN